MLIFVKLGGSIVTNKLIERHYRQAVVEQLAIEIDAACQRQPSLQLIIGHGSGSFGHYPAARFDTISGVFTSEQWQGFAQVAVAATELHERVTQSLTTARLPILPLQPSASAICRDGEIQSIAMHPITAALNHGLIPLIHGDVALDSRRGGTIISTEKIFVFLARNLPVKRVILLSIYPRNQLGLE